MTKTSRVLIPIPFSFWAVLLLAVVGIIIAAKLMAIHVAVHADPTTQSFCALSETINCDSVALSPYSVFAGLPVALWGLIGYSLQVAVALWGLRSKSPERPIAILLTLSAFGVVASIALATVSALAVKSLCILCLATYVVSFALFAIALRSWRQVRDHGPFRELSSMIRQHLLVSTAASLGLGAALGALILFYPKYWTESSSSTSSVSAATQRTPSEAIATSDAPSRSEHPSRGAETPRLTIVEYSDYECPFCRQAHFDLRRQLDSHPDVQLVHVHFPLDHVCNPTVQRPFHRRACHAAKLAICAQRQGRFWEANDYLYQSETGKTWDPPVFAATVGLDAARLDQCLVAEADEILARDVAQGIRLKVRGTPTFVIGDRVYVGRIPDEAFSTHGDAATPRDAASLL